jgi:hypothetical protein
MQMLRLPEPKLLFGHNQAIEDPRDGLTLFGPLDVDKTYGIRPAVIGTRSGIDRFWRWAKSIQRPVNDNKRSRPPVPASRPPSACLSVRAVCSSALLTKTA